MLRNSIELIAILLCFGSFVFAQGVQIQRLHGTLVVAVPVAEGLVVCSDKRLFNDTTGKSDDGFLKIRKVNSTTLFVATNTIGFLDKTTGKMEFDVFDITSKYVARNPFAGGPVFWSGLQKEIQNQLLAYLGKRKFADWPETDKANNSFLFNLIFYSVSDNRAQSYSLTVFYEKALSPIITIPGMVREDVRTPQLSGKGKIVMAYLSQHPELASDPAISDFDESIFDVKRTTVSDAVSFAAKLFSLTSKALPRAEVSSSHDCSLLSYQSGFRWIDDSGLVIKK